MSHQIMDYLCLNLAQVNRPMAISNPNGKHLKEDFKR